MDREQLRAILRPDNPAPPARLWRGLHHATTAAGIGVVLAATVGEWREQHGALIDGGFYLASAFFVAEYLARLIAAPADPSAADRTASQARCAYAASLAGAVDLFGALPGLLHAVLGAPDAILFGLVWVFKLVRYAPGLAGLQRVVSRARQPLFSVLLGFAVVLLASASLEYLIERHAAVCAGVRVKTSWPGSARILARPSNSKSAHGPATLSAHAVVQWSSITFF